MLQVINDELDEFGVEVRKPVRLCRECRFSHGPLESRRCEIEGDDYCKTVNPRGECSRWEVREALARKPPTDVIAFALPLSIGFVAGCITIWAALS